MSNLSNKIKKLTFLLKKDTSNHIKPCDILFICQDVDRSITLEGKAFSPILDSIVQDLQKRGYLCSSFSLPFAKYVGEKGFNNPLNANRSFLIYSILKRLGLPMTTFRLYDKVIKQSRAKLVLTIGSTANIARAVKNNNAYHIEVLHGMGYTRIEWGWDKLNSNELPHEIIALDKTSMSGFQNLESKGVKINYLPHPFLRKFLRKEVPQEWIMTKPSQYKKQIIITLQWGYAGDHGTYNELSGILNNGLYYPVIEELIEKWKDILWRFRLHPVQFHNTSNRSKVIKIEELCKRYKNTEWKESTTFPLPSILSQCNGHITMSSMSSYEASKFNIPTLALCPTLKPGGIHSRQFEDLVNDGLLIKGEPEVSSISNWIKSLKLDAESKIEDEEFTYSNSLDRILKQANLTHQSL